MRSSPTSWNPAQAAPLLGMEPARFEDLCLRLGVRGPGDVALACRVNHVRDLPGFGPEVQAKIARALPLSGLLGPARTLGDSRAAAIRVLNRLQREDSALRLAVGGDVRAMAPTVERVDLVATAHDAAALLEAFTTMTFSREVVSREPSRAHVVLEDGVHVALAVVSEEAFPSALGPGADGEGVVEMEDVRGLAHVHTSAASGSYGLEEMAQRAAREGYAWVLVADKSPTAFPRGLSLESWREQRERVRAWNEAEDAPLGILHGIEATILPDGSLDVEDEALSDVDLVLAALDDPRGQGGRPEDRAALTRRVLRAVRHPRVHVLARPTGRVLFGRPPHPLDMEAVLDACAEAGTAVEISGEPYRLDLDEAWHEAARSRGVKALLSADAHDLASVDDAILAVGTARRGGWRREEILNTMAADALLAWCRGKAQRSEAR